MTDTKPLSPRERLTATRQALLLHMTRHDREAQARARETFNIDPKSDPVLLASPAVRERVFGGVSNAVRTWWRNQPVSYAYDFAQPILGKVAVREPYKLLAISAAIGAAVVMLRPWRLVSLGSLLLGAVKSAAVPSVLMAMLSSNSDQNDNDL
jgi:hypothetical protein